MNREHSCTTANTSTKTTTGHTLDSVVSRGICPVDEVKQNFSCESERDVVASQPVICERFDTLGADGISRRLGIMGGTFDPIHHGHLACAEQVREAFNLDAVVFIPTGQPVFKRHQRVAPAQERLAMCRVAVADNPYFDVSDIEIIRGGDTYTIDTLRILNDYYPDNVDLYFIAGADAIATISQWKAAEEMGKLARFVGVDRPGYELSKEHRQKIVKSVPGLDISFLTIEALAISSSELRHRLEAGLSIRYFTPQVVVDHVMEHELYSSEEVVHG